MQQPVLVIGGGIGGLTTAIALSYFGIETRVFERDDLSDKTGAGIQLSPNATRVLFQLGLEDALRQHAMPASALIVRNWKSGRVESQHALGRLAEQQCGYPYLQVLRRFLIQVLAEKCQSDSKIQLFEKHPIDHVDPITGQVSMSVRNKSQQGLLIVGADGVHSVVRRSIGIRNRPTFSGWQAWRTIIESGCRDSRLSQATNVWSGRTGHIVHYPVNREGLLNLVLITRGKESVEESWRVKGSTTELRNLFADWHPEIADLIDSINEQRLFRWGLYRHQMRPGDWKAQRAVLIGDACHSVLPFLAQGAALAIEDAFALARCLAESVSPSDSLERFVALRWRRTLNIQRRSANMGRIYHLSQPWSTLRNWFAGFAVNETVRTVYGFDATSLR